MKKLSVSLFALLTTLLLTGCGGGGSSSESGGPISAGTSAPNPVSNAGEAGNSSHPGGSVGQDAPSTITTRVPDSSYSSGSEQQKAFALLNAERVACGFGAVAQNEKLDATAAGHANYLLVTNSIGHFQNVAYAGETYFTGNGPLDRATTAGYDAASIVDLQTAGFGFTDLTGRGAFSVRSLLSAPYHMTGLVASYRDVGISIMNSDQVGTTGTLGARTIEQYNFAVSRTSSRQLPAGSEVLTYPCQGTAGTFFELVNESPNPIPGRDLLASPLGQSVLVQVRDGQTVTITSAKLSVNDANGTPVPLRSTMTSSNDPNAMVKSNQAIIMPDVALLPMTRYYVVLAGTNDGVNFNKSFTFTTGSGTGR